MGQEAVVADRDPHCHEKVGAGEEGKVFAVDRVLPELHDCNDDRSDRHDDADDHEEA